MKIALIGYGKMGHIIEKVALQRGHEIALTIDAHNIKLLNNGALAAVDVAIEFTTPETALHNIKACANTQTPVVVGTTGWYTHYDEACEQVKTNNGALLAATNFSVGVNLFFALNKKLAAVMQKHSEYHPEVTEIHHIHKKDAPSGTGITLAEGVLEAYTNLEEWKLSTDKPTINQLQIRSIRDGEVPGTHEIEYNSIADTIRIVHQAHNREGFAVGAVLAAEYLAGKKGIFTMQDVLGDLF